MSLADYVEGLVEGRRGFLVQQKKERQVYAFPGDPLGPLGATHWVKRGWGAKAREIRREAENARTLERMGLGPAVTASGRLGDSEWLVLEDVGGPLPNPPDLHRGRDLAAVAAAVRRLHDAGLSFPDLMIWHIYVCDGAKLIDSARLSRHRGGAPTAVRARDLAQLLFSDPPMRMHRADRVRLVAEATGARGAGLRDMLRRIDDRIVALSRRTRWRHGWACMSEELMQAVHDRFEAGLLPRVTGWMVLFDPPASDFVRRLPDRENRVLGNGGNGRPLFFLKRFPATRRPTSPAMTEFAAIDAFQRAGILVNRVAAMAEDLDLGSIVAVRACRGEPLDDLLRRGVTVAERRALAVQTARIWRRMRECGLRHRDAYPCHLFVAPWVDAGAGGIGTAERPPEAGTPNCGGAGAGTRGTSRALDRDSVSGTPLGVPPSGGRPLASDAAPRFELRLIDLTRAGLAPFPKERWFVKDAAQLWHGCPRPPVTRTDAVRWLREYFRVPKLTRAAKRFARKVAAKERSIAAHVARKADRARKARRAGKSS